MLRIHCIRQFLYVGLFIFLYHGVSFAQSAPATYLGCLVAGDFGRCVEDGPLSARLVADMTRAVDEAAAGISAGGDDGRWAQYALRFAERDLLERVSQTFDLSRRSPETLPLPVRDAVNRLAVDVARLTGGAANPTLEAVWTPATRARLAALVPETAEQVAQAAPEDDSDIVGKRFVQVFAHAREEAALARKPVSPAQYTRLGLYQLQATECLMEARDPARAVELHNELAAWSDELLAQGEEVSPDVHELRNHLLHGLLEAGA